MDKTLEQIIEIVSERAIEVIDDSLYEMIGKDEDDPDGLPLDQALLVHDREPDELHAASAHDDP